MLASRANSNYHQLGAIDLRKQAASIQQPLSTVPRVTVVDSSTVQ